MDTKKLLIFIFLAFTTGMLTMYVLSSYKITRKNTSETIEKSTEKNSTFRGETNNYKTKNDDSFHEMHNIDELTKDELVVRYVKEHGELPEYYIKKGKAKKMGWEPGKGNLCEVAPGKAIGGDTWTNRQKSLPTKVGRTYFEADLNYQCGRRNADRIVFSNDGLIYVTYDHYKTFEEK